MAGRFGAGPSLVLPACVGVAGLTLICIGQFGPNRHAIQDDLTSRSTAALASARLTGLSVSFSGRDATITGATTAEQADRAEDLVSSVDGVRVVKADLAGDAAAVPSPAAPAAGPSPAVTDTPAQAESPATEAPATDTSATETPATASPAATAAPVAVPVGFTLADGAITVTGTVRSTSAGHALIAAVKAAGNGWTVVDKLRLDGSVTAPAPKAARLPALTRLLATAPISGNKLVIQYSRGSVILRGTPADATAERKLLTAAAATVATKAAVVDGLDTP